MQNGIVRSSSSYPMIVFFPIGTKPVKSIMLQRDMFSKTGVLYRRELDGILLRCLTRDERKRAMQEAHKGSCGEHQRGHRLHQLLLRISHYWPTMFNDCVNYSRSYPSCHLHAPLKHLPLEPLHPLHTGPSKRGGYISFALFTYFLTAGISSFLLFSSIFPSGWNVKSRPCAFWIHVSWNYHVSHVMTWLWIVMMHMFIFMIVIIIIITLLCRMITLDNI